MSMPEATPPPDLSLRDLAQFAEGQARRLAANFGFDPKAQGGHVSFALAQTVKLGEEVGELQAEVLGALEFQRREKAGRYSRDTLGGELADVMVCVAILADTFGVDLARAVGSKIEQLEARDRKTAGKAP
jgi:NTP pyrophosphatase (non-canonical NTP hydrolase)